MTPINLLRCVIRPALRIMGARYGSREAEVMLVAIALQESRLQHRVQVGGPAHGYWQFESGGGVKGVLGHPSSSQLARSICYELNYNADQPTIYAKIVDNDLLACVIARLLLYTDPKPLPAIGDANGAWEYYKRNWRPGKPHPETWAANYAQAMNTNDQ